MLSKENLNVLRHSLSCFLHQTYELRELILLLKESSPELDEYLAELDGSTPPIHIYRVPKTLSLGDRRNMSIAGASGDLLSVWDDDDLRHPDYLKFMVGYIESNSVAGAFLRQMTMWWPAQKCFANSKFSIWEPTMVAYRSVVPAYPALNKGEDISVARSVYGQYPVALVDASHLYIYTVNGRNTWDDDHMVEMMSGLGAERCKSNAYKYVYGRLVEMYDISAYEKYCRESVSAN
jgi:glycosyltransferase involved in cell wall biosynthesis